MSSAASAKLALAVLLPVLLAAATFASRPVLAQAPAARRDGKAEALALAEQAPEHGPTLLPVLLETVDRTELALRPRAEAALRRVGPWVADELIEGLRGVHALVVPATSYRNPYAAARVATGDTGQTGLEGTA